MLNKNHLLKDIYCRYTLELLQTQFQYVSTTSGAEKNNLEITLTMHYTNTNT